MLSFLLFGQTEKQKINNIYIIGNDGIQEKDIHEILRIHEPRLFSRMDYDRRLIKLDAINIKTLYVSKGYLGVDIKDSINFINGKADIYFVINEGKRYYLRNIDINGNEIFSDRSISITLGLQDQKSYNPVKINSRLNELENKYREKGKLFLDINISDTIIDSVDISINITEGPDVYINKIVYSGVGNIDTNIVKREMEIQSNDLYNQDKVNQSQRQLLQIGVYSVANITPIISNRDEALVDLAVELRPFKQYEWISEGGYYPIEYYEGADAEPGAGVLVEWRNRSLFKTATSLSAKLSGQTLMSNNTLNPKLRFDVSLTSQWLYKIKIPSKAQIYIESFKDYISIGAPYVTRYGIELLNTYYLDKIERRSYIESRLYLDRFSRKDYLNIENDLTQEQSSKIKFEKHTFEINIRLDRADDILYPTKGVVYSGQINRTGGILGGNRDFWKLDFGIKGYQPIFGQVICAAQFKYGVIVDWDYKYHDYLYDKFYLGGNNNLRGWDMLRYQVTANDQPQGNINRILTNYEIRFPLFWLLGGELFVDGGYLNNDYKEISIADLDWDAGFGLTISTPLGPIRFDAAKAVTQDVGWKFQLGVQYIF